jgi:hypothetical protein
VAVLPGSDDDMVFERGDGALFLEADHLPC